MAARPLRAQLFEAWLARAVPGDTVIYHRGELARDRRDDPVLDSLADRVQALCVCRFDKVSRCGHVRGEVVGAGLIEVKTRRSQGETVYMAERIR